MKTEIDKLCDQIISGAMSVYVKGCEIAKAEYSGSMTVNFEDCEIGEVIIWNSNTNFTNCEITTLNKDNVTTATVIIK